MGWGHFVQQLVLWGFIAYCCYGLYQTGVWLANNQDRVLGGFKGIKIKLQKLR